MRTRENLIAKILYNAKDAMSLSRDGIASRVDSPVYRSLKISPGGFFFGTDLIIPFDDLNYFFLQAATKFDWAPNIPKSPLELLSEAAE